MQHKLIRGAKKTSVLKQLIIRYNKYAEVVPDSDSEDGKPGKGDSEDDESVLARRGMDDDNNRCVQNEACSNNFFFD